MANCVCKIGEFRIYKGDPLQSSDNTLLQTSLKVCAIFAIFSAGVLVGRHLQSNSKQENCDYFDVSSCQLSSRSDSFSIIKDKKESAVHPNSSTSNPNSASFPSAVASTAKPSSNSSFSSCEISDNEPTSHFHKSNNEVPHRITPESVSIVSSATSASSAQTIYDGEFILMEIKPESASTSTS